MSVNTTSPTSFGEVPDAVTEIGGIVLDIVGASGVRVVAQLPASSLFEGFFSSTVGTIGTLEGLTPEVITALGGGITEIAVRLTVYDADTSSGNFDFNQNWLQVGGVRIESFSTVETYRTDSAGNIQSGPTNGFGNETLDTGWFYNDDETTLAQVFTVLQDRADNGTGLDFGLEDLDSGDNFFDFKQGIDGGLIDIGSFNVVPVANDDAVTVSEDDAPQAIDVRANDVDSGPFAVDLIDGLPADQLITLESGATLQLDANGDVVFAQNDAYQYLVEGQSVTEQVTYRVSDPQNASDTATLSITIEGREDAPVLRADQFVTNEDASELTGNLFADNGAGLDTDVDAGSSFQITAINGQAGNVGQVIGLGGGLLVVTAEGAIGFQPNGAYDFLPEGGTVQEQFTYTVTDNTGLSATETVTITITGVNDAPQAVDDSVSTLADATLEFDPAANDLDADTPPLRITGVEGQDITAGPVTLASGAIVTLVASGLSYDPNGVFTLTKGAVATDSFSYQISDSEGVTSSAVVSVDVVGPNTAPRAQDDVVTLDEDVATRIDVLTNDVELDAGDVLVTALQTGPSNGSVQRNPDGSFIYTPDLDFNGTDSFTYSVSDGTDSDLAEVRLTITAQPDAPVAVDDTAVTEAKTPITIDVLTNDSDPEEDSFAIVAVGEASDGTVSFDGTNVTYTPLNGFVGTDSFTYTVADAPSGLESSATVVVNVTPGPLPDLVASNAALEDGQGDAFSTASWTVSNAGAATVSDTIIEQLWLSRDDVLDSGDLLLRTVSFGGDLDSGEGIERTARVTLPDAPGSYRLIVQLDSQDTIDEETETNNLAVSDLVTVSAAYTAAILSAPTSAASGDVITVTGRATDTLTGDGEAFEFVTVDVAIGQFTQSFNAFTDADGFFSLNVATLEGTGGVTQISARNPGVPDEDSTAEALIDLFGMGFARDRLNSSVVEGQSIQTTLTLENFSDLALTDLSVVVDGVAEGLTAEIVSVVPQTLAGDQNLDVTLEISAEAGTTLDSDTFSVSFDSAQGASADAQVNVQVIELAPRLVVSEGELSGSILLGAQTLLTVELTNVGAAATGDLNVILPGGLDFINLLNSDLPSLDPGESFELTFSLTPDADLPIGTFEGSMVVSSVDAQILLPFDFVTTSSETGTLSVSLVSESFFLADPAEKVQDAKITVRDYFTNEVVAMSTDVDGDISFPDLTAGFYRVQVSADGHDSVSSTVEVLPGRTVELESFMSETTVSYTWTVEEIEFEDRYVVDIESTFTANVPQPVVVLDPPVIDVFELDNIGEAMTVDLTVTNHGLIAAQNLLLNLGSHPWYSIEPLIDGLDELDAQSSVTIPVRVIRIGDETTDPSAAPVASEGLGIARSTTLDTGGIAASAANIIPCFINGLLSYEFPCGDYNVAKALGVSFANVDGNCGTPFSYRPGGVYISGGEFDLHPVASFVPATTIIDLCDLLRVVFDCAPLFPLPPHIQLGLAVAEFLTFGPGEPAPPQADGFGVAAARGLKGGLDLLDDFDDALDQILPIVDTITQAGKCAKAVGDFIGNETLSNLGEDIQNVGETIGEPLQIINDIVDPLDDLLEGDFPFANSTALSSRLSESTALGHSYSAEFEAAFAVVKQSYRDFVAVGGSIENGSDALGIADEARALRDALQDLIDTGELSAEEEAALRDGIGSLRDALFTIDQLGGLSSDTLAAIADIELLDDLGSVFIGGDVWVENMGDARVQTFIQDFFDMMRASFDEPTLLTESQRADLLARDLPEAITTGDRVALFDLWFERLTDAGTTDTTSRVFQDAAELQRLLAEIETAEDAALAAGFTSLEDSINARTSSADDAANAIGNPSAGEACAQVRLSIQQDVALTRQGFLGTLAIDNTGPTALTDLEVTLEIRDAEGVLVEQNVFGVFDPVLEGLSAIDGSGTLAAGDSGSVEFTILPSRLAALAGSTDYTIGGTLSYSENGVTFSADLVREPVTVLPQPELRLDYFQSRDVFGDDPFTDEIEDAVPFSLGVRVSNAGPGEATDLSIASAQPRIIDNEKGLLVDFEIIGTEVNGASIQPTLLADFGDLSAGETAQAVWKLQSSLQGVFSDYSASFRHVNGLGNDDLSLITDVTIRELVRVVDAGLPSADDGLSDFLVNDIADTDSLPDRIFFSEGGDAEVTIGSASALELAAGATVIEVEQQSGWFYTSLADPLADGGRIGAVQRVETDDSGLETLTDLSLENIWQTDRTFTEGGVAIYEDKLHLFDFSENSGTVAYRITLENSAPVLSLPEDAYVIASSGAQVFTALAQDSDSDPITYSLDSTSTDLFAIDAESGAVSLRTDVDVDAFLFTETEARVAEVDVQVSASDGISTVFGVLTAIVLRDSDGDGIQDIGYNGVDGDNAIDVANPDQADSNDDGYGTIIDQDLDNDGLIGFADFSLFVSVYNQSSNSSALASDSDFDQSGIVDFADYTIFQASFGDSMDGKSWIDLWAL